MHFSRTTRDGTLSGSWAPSINNAGVGSRNHVVGGFVVNVRTGFTAKASWRSYADMDEWQGEADGDFDTDLSAREGATTCSNLTGGWCNATTTFRMSHKMQGDFLTQLTSTWGYIRIYSGYNHVYQSITAGNGIPFSGSTSVVSSEYESFSTSYRYLN